MNRTLTLLLAFLGVATATAAEPAKPAKPAIEFRLKSVTELIPVIEYGGELAGQTEHVGQVVEILKYLNNQKTGLKGVDLTKPVGGYVIVADNVADSAIVLMVPVDTEEAFLGALDEDANFQPKKETDGTYTLTVPDFPTSAHLRFANGYGYIGLRSAAGVAADKLLTPKDFFPAKLEHAFELNVTSERIPADLRKVAYGQIELQLNALVKSGNTAEKALQQLLVDRLADMAKAVLMDAEKLTLTFDVKPDTDDIDLNLTLTPKSNTTLAKMLTQWGDRPSRAASLALSPKYPALAIAANFGLPTETKAALNAFLDTALNATLETADGAGKVLMKQIADAVLPTLKAGEFELGVALTGPNDNGKFGGVFALRTEAGQEIKRLVQSLSVLLPESVAKIQFDVTKASDGQLHTITSPALENPKFAAAAVQLFTSDTLYAGTVASKTDTLKDMVATKPNAAPMLHAEVSVVKLFRLLKDVDADKMAKMIDSAFGKPVRDGEDTIQLTVRGGQDFQLKLKVKGRALAFLRVVNE